MKKDRPKLNLHHSRGLFFCFVFAAFAGSSLAHAGLVTGVEASGSVFTFNFNNSFTLPDASKTANQDWRGDYQETVNDFTLSLHSGPNVDFNNWDNDFDVYQFDIDSFWKISLNVRIRDNALFSNEDVFNFDGTLRHKAGENLPHRGDSGTGELATVGFSTVNVVDLRPGDLVKIPPGAGGLLGGMQGTFWEYHSVVPTLHKNILGDHSDSYETYFLADVNTEDNSMSGYHILIHGQHLDTPPVPEPSSVAFTGFALLLISLGVYRRSEKRRRLLR